MQSQTLPLPADIKWRRLIVVALFLALLYFFRHLAPVFICFIVFERSLGYLADQIDARTPLHRSGAIAALLTAMALVIGLLVLLVVRKTLPLARQLREHGAGYLQTIFDHPSIEKLRAMAGLEGEGLGEAVKSHLGQALTYATGTGKILIFLLIGFLLAIIYLFERDVMRTWVAQQPASTVQGTLFRWFGYVGDAVAITVRMQVVVAVVNAVVTLPVLLFLGLPHIPLLFLLILVTGLLPVVGNLISGAVLCYVAYTSRGAWAVGVFLVTTFILGKVESYYLNPRLASEHVKLPNLVLVTSLLLFEAAFGFVGLFLSFPALFVASRIAHEWRVAADVRGVAVPAEAAREEAREEEALVEEMPPVAELPVEEMPPVAEAPVEEMPPVAEAPVEDAPPVEEAPAEAATAEAAPAEAATAEAPAEAVPPDDERKG